MYQKAKKYTLNSPRLKKVMGIFLLFIGFIALITPFTPGATILLFVGFELLGLRFILLDKILGKKL